MSNLLNIAVASNIVVRMKVQSYNQLRSIHRKQTEYGNFAVVNGQWVKVRLER